MFIHGISRSRRRRSDPNVERVPLGVQLSNSRYSNRIVPVLLMTVIKSHVVSYCSREEDSKYWDHGGYAIAKHREARFFMISLNLVSNFPIVGVMMHRIPEAEMQPSTAEDLLAVVTIYSVSTGSR